MTASELRELQAITKSLTTISSRADKLNLKLSNGAEVGSLIGTIAAELETKIEEAKLSPEIRDYL